MERQPNEPEQLATVLPFRKRDTETIAGQVIHLGLLSDIELELLEKQCAERVEEARTELMMVAWHMLSRTEQ